MKLDELNEEERLALVALLKLVVQADMEVTREEHVVLRGIASRVGEEAFWGAVEAAKPLVKTREDARTLARRVSRPEAQAAIYAALVEAAEPGKVVEPELKVLDWLAETWQKAK
jgi:hypothetical protein